MGQPPSPTAQDLLLRRNSSYGPSVAGSGRHYYQLLTLRPTNLFGNKLAAAKLENRLFFPVRTSSMQFTVAAPDIFRWLNKWVAK